jgi:hypothetical protein
MNATQRSHTKATTAFSLLAFPLILAMATSGEGLAARKVQKQNPGALLNGLTPTSESLPQRTLATRSPSAQPLSTESRQPYAVRQKKITSGEAPSTGRKSRRAMKASKKAAAKAVVQPRTDLIPYGMLVDSQRYDPRPRAASPGVTSPQALDLTHDHFQELDRNQDGRIDPVERAFGRIDMDRDLHTRTLQ